jgi:hypothetical protein
MAAVVQATATRAVPWKPASQVADAQGVNMCVFGFPGSGKTTFAATGPKPLIVDLDGTAARSLSDRDDVQIASAKGGWDEMDAISNYLLRSRPEEIPFETISWDTVSAMQTFALKKVMKQSATPQQPSQPEYGQANQMVIDFVEKWCLWARKTGMNVVFPVHAQEIKDEASGIITLRMDLTPGCLKGVSKAVDSIGYLGQDLKGKRKLLLHNTAKVVAKHHQPQTGSGRIDLEIDEPNLSQIISTLKGRKAIA